MALPSAVLLGLFGLKLLGGLTAAPLFTLGLRPIPDGGKDPTQLSAQACIKCHAATVHQWQTSRHGQAWTNAIFQREYQQQPLAWCVHCHAPLQSQFDQVSRGGGALASEGVTCAVCHLRDGKMLARRTHPGSPHQTVARPDYGDAEFCAGCHQFNFPLFAAGTIPRSRRADEPDDQGSTDQSGQVIGYSKFPMQNTVAQFRIGPHREGRCLDCHSRGAGGHTFPGAHDPAMLTRALTYKLCRDAAALRLTLTNQGAGHNVPTGDVHRHIVARLWRSTSPERLFEASLGRRYEPVASGGKRTTVDTTLPPGHSQTHRIPLQSLGLVTKSDESIRFELRYVYTIDEFPLPNQQLSEPTFAVIAAETVLPTALPACTH